MNDVNEAANSLEATILKIQANEVFSKKEKAWAIADAKKEFQESQKLRRNEMKFRCLNDRYAAFHMRIFNANDFYTALEQGKINL